MDIKNTLDAVNEWLTPSFDAATQEAVQTMNASCPQELEESFYKNLEFGTGGMRGIMGVGNNRINKYTLGKSTQGLSNYLHQCFPDIPIKAVIAYDCRHNSNSLAKVVADVFSANGIQVYLFSGLRSTPELSFTVKQLNCQCGIVLTASHNPPEYNGYKVYWEDGGQIVPPEDFNIINEIKKLDYNQIKFDANEALIEYINSEIDEAFIASSITNASFDTSTEAKENLNIVFTSLHGTSITVIPDTLSQAGYHNVNIVPEQAVPNGDFPTVKSPNPEEPEALAMALALADKTNADIVIGTDPDCDRLGIAVRNNEGEMTLLNGNQSMILMTAFLLDQWKKAGKINGRQFVGSTIVSTPMIERLATAYGVECKLGLTGFKWIAKMIKDFPELEFIGGGEESFGYMVGDAVRDKDAVAATLLICEVAAQAKAKGSSVYKELLNLYVTYGFYKEHLISITKKGMEGLAEINQMMVSLRENPLHEINGQKVIRIEDYKSSLTINLITGEKESMDFPKADVLIYFTEDGSKICARPSGTEPKIKFYISVHSTLDCIENYTKVASILKVKINSILPQFELQHYNI
ncbi:phospho-sugar mutase [Flavobacterium cellulosilyticum]|uniref:Phospho-sugar mutase n=1 Tax=Flavobacterium cellulosilyticum TaxID=2541731 RepID=A0A4R5C8H5_9FLAO|nr:phospho-sugar mutase [Flavobacterium cellulosilyticum]TDD95079.1 phospho-sugar mutase [Flavobacterium cellulosilyticum]